MEQPLISIIIPVYNREPFLEETLNSVVSQSFFNWECIIVDDGSTDNSMKIADQFAAQNPRFKVFQRERNPKGAPTCRNIGIAKSTASYIIFLDSDDLLAPNCLENRMSVMQQNPELDMVIAQTLLFKEKVGDRSECWNELINEKDDLLRFMQFDPPWNTMSCLWKKEALNKIKGWDESLNCWQDWEIHVKAIVEGLKYQKISNADPDCYCRTAPDYNSIKRNEEKISNLETKEKLYFDTLTLLKSKKLLSPELKQGIFSLLLKLLHGYKNQSSFDASGYFNKLKNNGFFPDYSNWYWKAYIKLFGSKSGLQGIIFKVLDKTLSIFQKPHPLNKIGKLKTYRIK